MDSNPSFQSCPFQLHNPYKYIKRSQRDSIARMLTKALEEVQKRDNAHEEENYSGDIETVQHHEQSSREQHEHEILLHAIDLLKKPTYELRYFSHEECELIDELLEKYESIIQSATANARENASQLLQSDESPSDCIQCTFTLSKRNFAEFMSMLEQVQQSLNGNHVRKKVCSNVLAQLKGYIQVECLDREQLLDRVEKEMGEPVPNREVWLRLFEEHGGQSSFQVSTGESCTRLFYQETDNLRTDLNYEDYTTKDSCCIREIIAWVYRNAPELDSRLEYSQ